MFQVPSDPRPVHRRQKHDLEHRTEQAEEIALELRVAFERAFLQTLSQINVSDTVKQHLIKRELTVPLVEVISKSKDILRRTHELGFERAGRMLYPDEVLIVVHLPRILRHPDILSRQPAEATNILSHLQPLYLAGIDGLWSAMRDFCQEHGLMIQRLNHPHQHDNNPDGYYYVFALTPQDRSLIPWTTETRTREEPIEDPES